MASKAKATTTSTPATNGSLPKGWRIARFDELAQMVNERVDPSKTDAEIYVGLEHLDPDSHKLRRWGTPSEVIGDKLQFRKGDIIFGRRRAYQRKLAVAEFDGICSAHAMVVRAKTETVDPEFLPFLMQSDLFMQRAIDISVGSLSPTINWKTLRIQEFPLPPKDEQRRIADILWAADEALEAFTDAQKHSAALLQAFSKIASRFRRLRMELLVIHALSWRSAAHFSRGIPSRVPSLPNQETDYCVARMLELTALIGSIQTPDSGRSNEDMRFKNICCNVEIS